MSGEPPPNRKRHPDEVAAMEGVRRTAHTGLGRWRELPPARNLYVALA